MKASTRKAIKAWFQRYVALTSFACTAWIVLSAPRFWDTTIYHINSWVNSIINLIP